MSQMLLGWPNGVLGMIFASLAGAAIMYDLWRQSPWDIHDEHSYAEPKRLTFRILTPDIVLFAVLVSLMLGVGALDNDVWPPFAMVGDVLGLITLLLAAYHLLSGSPATPMSHPTEPADEHSPAR